jgi:hypothetical protein
MKVITFDPGKYTGWSVWINGRLYMCGVSHSMLEVAEVLRENTNADVCVYEGFARANAAARDQIDAMEMCGAIQGIALYAGIPRVEKQYPAVRKGYIQFAKNLPALRNVPSDVRRHAVDAIAHGLRFHDKLEGYEWKNRPF